MTNTKNKQQNYTIGDFHSFRIKNGKEYENFKKYYRDELDYNNEELKEAHADAVVENFTKLSEGDRFSYINEKSDFILFLNRFKYVITYYKSGEFGFTHIADFDYEEDTDYIKFHSLIQNYIYNNDIELTKEKCKALAQICEKVLDEDGNFIYNENFIKKYFNENIIDILENEE